MPTHDESSDLESAPRIDQEASVVEPSVEVEPVPELFWRFGEAQKKKKGKKGIEISSWN